jgi:hypothetical protein
MVYIMLNVKVAGKYRNGSGSSATGSWRLTRDDGYRFCTGSITSWRIVTLPAYGYYVSSLPTSSGVTATDVLETYTDDTTYESITQTKLRNFQQTVRPLIIPCFTQTQALVHVTSYGYVTYYDNTSTFSADLTGMSQFRIVHLTPSAPVDGGKMVLRYRTSVGSFGQYGIISNPEVELDISTPASSFVATPWTNLLAGAKQVVSLVVGSKSTAGGGYNTNFLRLEFR